MRAMKSEDGGEEEGFLQSQTVVEDAGGADEWQRPERHGR